MRVLALDYGRARCGCAISDPTGVLATPLAAIAAPDSRRGRARLRALDLRARCRSGSSSGCRCRCRAATRPRRLQRARSPKGSQRRSRSRSSSTTSASRRSWRSVTAASADEDSRAAAHLLDGWLTRRRRRWPMADGSSAHGAGARERRDVEREARARPATRPASGGRLRRRRSSTTASRRAGATTEPLVEASRRRTAPRDERRRRRRPALSPTTPIDIDDVETAAERASRTADQVVSIAAGPRLLPARGRARDAVRHQARQPAGQPPAAGPARPARRRQRSSPASGRAPTRRRPWLVRIIVAAGDGRWRRRWPGS